MQSQEEELFDAGRFDDAAELMARAWLVGPEREPEQVDADSARARVVGWCCAATSCRPGAATRCCASRSSRRAIAAPTLVDPRRARLARRRRGGASVSSSEMPDAREAVIDGCAHLPTLERPDEVARLILDFLGERGADGAPSAPRAP